LCIVVFFCLFLAAVISIQLMRTSTMDQNERISASRMTYYLLIIALIYVSFIPSGLCVKSNAYRSWSCPSRSSPSEETL
jgi:hypothetical protein